MNGAVCSGPYTLYYWGDGSFGPPAKGRGEFVRLLFVAAGVDWVEENDLKTIVGLCHVGESGRGVGLAYPAAAPPVVTGPEQFCVSNTPAILMALGKRLGLCPEHEADEARAAALVATVTDFVAEGRLAFHAVDPTGSYKTQAAETQPAIDRFAAKRLPRWIDHLEHCLTAAADGSGYFFGGALSYADIAVFHAVDAARSQFAAAFAELQCPALKAHHQKIEALPRIAAYRASARCRPFSGDSMM